MVYVFSFEIECKDTKKFWNMQTYLQKYTRTRIKLREKDEEKGILSPTNRQNRNSTAGKQPHCGRSGRGGDLSTDARANSAQRRNMERERRRSAISDHRLHREYKKTKKREPNVSRTKQSSILARFLL